MDRLMHDERRHLYILGLWNSCPILCVNYFAL